MKNPIISAILENTHFKTDDFSFEDVYRITIGYLKNTEQILTGADWGYLSSYTIAIVKMALEWTMKGMIG